MKLFISAALLACCTLGAAAQSGSPYRGLVRTSGYEPSESHRDQVTMVDERLKPFYHGVASGDPTQSSFVIWTRVTPQNGDEKITLTYRVALDPDLQQIVTSGIGEVSSETDFCFKKVIADLEPGRVYYYGFSAYDRYSLTGRSRTFPEGGLPHAKIAVVTCANYPAGFFNAYGRIAERNDIDVVLHMGDYIYEYDADTNSFGGDVGKRIGRVVVPDKELVELVDYRTRYAQYRTDPDLMRLHQQHPMIHVWDDHESANDAWREGAQNHDPTTQGPWSERLATSKRVHAEWMPLNSQTEGKIYRSFHIGDLVDIAMLDTRIEGRDRQVSNVSKDAPQSSKDSLQDPNRKIMSQQQYDWLTNEIETSTTKWRVIGSQVLFSPIESNPIDTTYLFEQVGDFVSAILRPQIPQLQDLFDRGFKGDVWSNYPAQRKNLVDAISATTDAGNIVVSGDFHVSMAIDGKWPDDEQSLVEFMTPSITSSNFDENLGAIPLIAPLAPQLIESIDSTLRKHSPQLRWSDLNNHGYMILDLTGDKAQADWFFVDTLYVRDNGQQWVKGYSTTGDGSLVQENSESPAKSRQDIPTPIDPPSGPVSVQEQDASTGITLIGFGPNPATSALYLSFVSDIDRTANIELVSAPGTRLEILKGASLFAGLNSVVLDVSSVASGGYQLQLQSDDHVLSIPVIIRH